MPPNVTSPPHRIVLAVDGLRASPLGAYGGATGTPEIDRFASRSTLYDAFFSTAPELENAYASLWSSVPSLASQYNATLLTDDELTPLAERAGFHAVEQFSAPSAAAPAQGIAETWLAERLASLAESIAACLQREGPQLVWGHTRGFFGPWDAPEQMIQAQLDEDDPSIESSIEPAAGRVTDDGPDASFAAACRYAAQLQVFDACFGGFLEYVEELLADTPYELVLLGVRGYALGEHGVLGPDDRLYVESLHTPLVIYRSNGAGALHRVGVAVDASSLGAVLAGSGERDFPTVIRQASQSGAQAVQSGDWRLVQPASTSDTESAQPRLFLKPDDRWEANEVASLMPGVVDDLLPLLPPPADVAANGGSG